MLLLLACCCMLHGCKLTVLRCGAPDGQRGPARDPGMCPDFLGHYHNPCNSLLDFSHNSGVFSKRPAWPLVCLCQPRSSSSSSSCGRWRRRAALLRQPSMPGSSGRVAAPAVFSSYCPSLHVAMAARGAVGILASLSCHSPGWPRSRSFHPEKRRNAGPAGVC